MAKGKITEYGLDSFSRQAVGTPGADRSGQIIAQGAGALGQAIAKRVDTSNTLSAMDKFGDFNFEYEQKKLNLQKQYQDNPLGYPEAVKKMTDDLINEHSKGMPGGVFSKFKGYASNLFTQDAANTAKWAFTQDFKLQYKKAESINQNIALSAATVDSPDKLLKIIGKKGVDAEGNPITLVQGDFDAANEVARKAIGFETADKLTEDYRKQAITYAMEAQLMARPMSLKVELEGGAWDNVLTSDVISSYSDKTRNAILNKTVDEQYRGVYLAADNLQQFVRGIDDGSKTLIDLINERDAAVANRNKVDALGRPVVSAKYIKALENMVGAVTQSSQRTYTGRDLRARAKDAFDRKWDAFFQTKQMDKDPASPDDLETELEIYSDLFENYKTGIIDKNDLLDKMDIMNTKHKSQGRSIYGQMPFGQAIEQAGMKPGGWFSGPVPGNDVVSLGYQMVKDFVDMSYGSITPEERLELKAQMLSKYHQQIKNQPEGYENGLKTEADRYTFARKILYGGVDKDGNRGPGIAQQYSMHSFRDKQYGVGETLSDALGATKVFMGKDPNTGKDLWVLSPESKNLTKRRGGITVKPSDIDSETGEIVWTEI